MKKKNPVTWREKLLIPLLFVFMVSVFLLIIYRELSLEQTQKRFLTMLETEAGNYNDDRIVLTSTNQEEAESLAEVFGGVLRITDNGQFAVITLPEGMTLHDVADNNNYRKYLDKILLDYNNFSIAVTDSKEDVSGEGVRANYQVDDAMYPQQTYLDYINIGDVWTLSRGANSEGEKVTIAIIDSGIDTDHPEFYDSDGNSIISNCSYDATNDKVADSYGISVVEDEDGHGTAVAGVIAAQMNEFGIAGLAPDVELLVIKCEVDEAGEFKSSADIVFAIYYAIEQDVDVINMSLGGSGSTDMMDALQLAVDSDIIPVAAAGNDSTDKAHYPAAFENTIGVGALDADLWLIADYSNYGINSDVMAPGTTLTAEIGGGYTYQNGTSMAAPIISAAAALYVAQNEYVTYEDLKADLLAAGKDLGDLGEDYYYGFGALDLEAFICDEKGTITYDYCTEEIENTEQVFVRQHTIQTVPEPERDNIIFDDWYYDKAYTRVFDYDAYYSTEFVEDITLYAKWVNEDDEDASVYTYRTLENGTIEIVEYKGKRRYLTIPDTIDGKIVSSIGTNAFQNNTRIKEVIFPEGLTMINSKAFYNVEKLRKITFTGIQLVTIQELAFAKCTSLRTLDMPDSVISIGTSAFEDCTALTTVNISENSRLQKVSDNAFANSGISYFYLPKSVTSDGFNGSVLADCSNMRGISVHPDNGVFVVNKSTLYNQEQTEIVYYPAALTGAYTVADGVNTIGKYAFASSNISEIDLNNVVTISKSAFQSTKKLTTVVLVDSITSLEESAFKSSSINKVTISGNVTAIMKSVFADSKLETVNFAVKVQTIGEGAFSGCTYLRNITFAEGSELQTISKEAFKGCSLLGDFELPDSLMTIEKEAFSRCRNINKVQIPTNVNSIGEDAFRYCSNLQSVEFKSDCVLTKIPQYCFANCTALNTVTFADSITTIEESAFRECRLLENLSFSESSNLSELGDYCFYSCSSLKSMQLPDSVTVIGEFCYAFSGLTQIYISENVTEIENAALGACYSLSKITVAESNGMYTAVDNVLFDKEISVVYCVPSSRKGSYTLPETVRITAPYSFYYDKYLTSVTLPESLEDIQMNSFYYCSNLVNAVIPDNVANIGRQAFENCSKLVNVYFGENSKLQRLGMYTFVRCGFSEIIIPGAVESMAQYVFYNCNNLKKITFAEGSKLVNVSAYMFMGTPVEKVIFEDGSALNSLQAHAFEGANNLKTVDFGNAELTTIDNYAFYDCAKLEEINIPDAVTYIGYYAFYGCTSLNQIVIPALVDYIGTSAFCGTNNIKAFFEAEELPTNIQIDWDKGIAGYFLGAKSYVETVEWEYTITYNDTIALVRYKGNASKLTLDNLDGYVIEKIGARCFYDNDKVTKVTLGEDIKEIGNYAFAECDGLEVLSIPAAVEKIGAYAFANAVTVVKVAEDSVLESIGSYAFSGNNTTVVAVPDSLTEIGEGAFYQSAITEITISENSSLQSIGRLAFAESALNTIYLPATLTEVGAEAFKNVLSLESVEMADGDMGLKLSNSAFENSGIKEVNIPARVYYIGEYTFGSCPELKDIYVDTDNKSFTSVDGILCDIYGTTLIQYPTGRSGAYEVPAQISVLTYASFKNAKGLTEVTFAEESTVKTIGWETFSGCENLTKISVPDTVISFDFYAFKNCEKLTDVELGTGTQLNGVYEGAFYNCASLVNISLPDSIVEISDYAFYNCVALSDVPLSENAQVKGIYDYAFYGCKNIMEIPDFSQIVEIGECAFAHTGISEYTVPTTVKEIASNAFVGCESFAVIYCAEDNEEFISINGILYEKGASGADDLDSIVVWPYALTYVIGEGKAEITGEDTAILKEIPDIKFQIADTVKKVGASAFKGYSGLKTITIPSNITEIGSYAFYGCNDLIIMFEAEALPVTLGTGWDGSATVCLNVKSFGWTEDGLGYCITNDNNVIIAKYNGSKNVVEIPEQIEGIDVTEIAEYSFRNNSILNGITISENIVTIGNYAFFGCKELKEIYYNAISADDIEDYNNIFSYAGNNSSGITVIIGADVSRIPAFLFKPSFPNEYSPNITSVVFGEGSVCEYIGVSAFQSCIGLESVTIPESVRSIGNYAFADCFGLKEIHFNPIQMDDLAAYNNIFRNCGRDTDGITVTIGKSVSKIPAYAFNPWNYKSFSANISKVIFGEESQCSSIGNYAFSYNDNLRSISIPESITDMGTGAFQECKGLVLLFETGILPISLSDGWQGCASICLSPSTLGVTANGIVYYVNSENNVVVLKYWGQNAIVEVPEQIAGYNVTVIDDYAFYGRNNLTGINIPDSVTGIGNYAFDNTAGLMLMFAGEELPESLGENWSGDATVCVNVKSYGVTECNQFYCITNDNTAIVGVYSGTAATVTIPDEIEGALVTEIANNAYYQCSALTSIEIPETITRIGANAFYECIGISDITIPESVTEIGTYAFYGCTALENIEFNAISMNDLSVSNFVFGSAGYASKGVKVIIGEKVTKIPTYLFCPYNSSNSVSANIVSVTFKEGTVCESIGNNAFQYCDKLVDITIPDSITNIGNYAFYYCKELTDFAIPGSVSSIGNSAFQYCTNLANISIENGVESIGNYAFNECSGLTKVLLPDSITSIGTSAFNSCNNLIIMFTGTELPATVGSNWYGAATVAMNIEHYGTTEDDFFYCITNDATAIICNYSGTDVAVIVPDMIENAIVTETANTFFNRTDIESVTLPDTLTKIGKRTFYGCSGLVNVDIPDTVVDIGNYAFYNCRGLTDITIPEGVEILGSYAFSGCSSLSSIVIPESVKTIRNSVFSNCKALEKFRLNAKNIEASSSYSVFDNAGSDSSGIAVTIGSNVTKIPAYFFSNAKYVTSIVFEEGSMCESIGTQAFEYSTGFSVIIIPESVTQIGNYAFRGCDGLLIMFEGVELPSTLGASWSQGATVCTNVRSYGETDYGQFYYIKNDNTAVVAKYSGTDEIVDIPETIQGATVVEIASNAFYNCQDLLKITIPGSVTKIGDYAFRFCENLVILYKGQLLPEDLGNYWNQGASVCVNARSYGVTDYGQSYCITNDDTVIIAKYTGTATAVEIPETLEGYPVAEIASSAFYGCNKVTDITIPETVTSIGDYAFYYCTAMEKIVIPDSVLSIDKWAFYRCDKLKEVILSDSLQTLGDYVFYNCTKLTTINLPESLVNIGTQAFYYCKGLDSITIHENVKKVDNYAFWHCSNLKKVSITSPVIASSLTSSTACGYLLNYATTVLVDYDITEVGSYLTTNFTNTEQIVHDGTDYTLYSKHAPAWEVSEAVSEYIECQQDGVTIYKCSTCGMAKEEIIAAHDIIEHEGQEVTCTEIGWEAYKTCSRCDYTTYEEMEALGHDYVESSNLDVQDNMIYICSRCGEQKQVQEIASGYSGYTTWVLTEDGVLTLSGEGIMKNYSNKSAMPWYDYIDQIKSVVLEEGVTSIGAYAFYGMTELESIVIPEGVTTIGEYAFKNSTSLDNVVLPSTLTKIEDSAFFGCTSLSAIEIPEGIYTIWAYTFKNCTSLAEVSLPDTLIKIDEAAFYGCSALTEMVIPDNVSIIGIYCFKNCSSLASVKLPAKLEQVREATFYGTALTSLEVPEGVTKIGPYAFKNCTVLATLSLPNSLTSIGEAAFYGSSISELVIPDAVSAIGSYAFKNCINLVSVQLPASLNDISEAAFYNCCKLETLVLPDNVASIGNYAFRKCEALKSVQFSENLITIGESSFYGCSALTELNIPEGVTTINGYAFKSCTVLVSVSLPAALNTLGESAFYGCAALIEITIPENVATVGDYCFSRSTGVAKITFTGNAPAIGNGAFSKVTAEVYYPVDNVTWTTDIMQNYGGTLNWVTSVSASTEEAVDVAESQEETTDDETATEESAEVIVGTEESNAEESNTEEIDIEESDTEQIPDVEGEEPAVEENVSAEGSTEETSRIENDETVVAETVTKESNVDKVPNTEDSLGEEMTSEINSPEEIATLEYSKDN